MVKRSKRIRRRGGRSARGSGRSITQVSTGIPRTIKRYRGDPPPLNLVSAQAVVVPFYVEFQIQPNADPFQVDVATSPNQVSTITLKSNDIGLPYTFYLDRDEVHLAAAVKLFGMQPSGTQINAIATEYAIQSCTWYGPVGGGQIRMGIDFGAGMPGAYASDEGTSSSRPVVKAVAPRLWWQKMGTSTPVNDAFAGFWIAGACPPPGYRVRSDSIEVSTMYLRVCRIDFLVHVRRSWYTATAAALSSMKATRVDQML